MTWSLPLLLCFSALAESGAQGTDAAMVAPDVQMVPLIEAAADEFGVPSELLLAMAWEASRLDPDLASQWGGYGAFDLREDGHPHLEDAAALLSLSPDILIDEPANNARGAAALLAQHALADHGGVMPDVDNLEDWWNAVEAYSGSHDPAARRAFAVYVYELVRFGIDERAPTGEPVRFGFIPVDIETIAGPQPMPPPDYSGIYTYTAACSSNFTNQSRSPSSIDRLIIHTTQGSYSGAISWFQNCSSNVSAHYVVRSSDGQITQMVAEEDKAWHVGSYNGRSIGIEHEGFVADPATWYTSAMYAESAKLAQDIVARTGVNATRTHIIAHSEAPGATHTDPGTGWDWDHYMTLVSGSYTVAGKLTGVIAEDDIYSGARIVGANVWIAETGETGVSNGEGYYTFQDLPQGTYTVHATAPGFDEATCAKTVNDSSTYWCSLALYKSVIPPDDPPDDDPPADDDTDVPDDPIDEPERDDEEDTGTPVTRAEMGCGCSNGGSSGSALWLLLPMLLLRRRE